MQTITITRPLLISLTVESAIRLKAKGLLDVMRLPESMAQVAALFEEPDRFAQVLYELLDTSRDRLTFDEFTASLPQAMPADLWEALKREIADFFQDPDQRLLAVGSLESVAQRHREMMEKQIQMLNQAATRGPQSGSLQESLVVTPDLSHSASSMTWSTDVSEISGPSRPV